MNKQFALITGLHWLAVLCYVTATVMEAAGSTFEKPRLRDKALLACLPGLLIHGAALLIWWRIVGHGPYMDRFEILSSNAWILVACFLVALRFYPRARAVGIFVYPAAFLMIAVGLFLRPEIKLLPPTFRSFWLILHIIFYKIAFASIIVAVGFALIYLLRERGKLARYSGIPDQAGVDLYLYRFAGFGFTFWSIGMLAGSIWAYQSWNVFWNWDPVQTWALITWVAMGFFLHLRRFFGWRGTRASWFYLACFVLSVVALFITPYIKNSIHAEYFR
jgi:ABC-type transport system involved in cytochrome c biogenesis permease subunit